MHAHAHAHTHTHTQTHTQTHTEHIGINRLTQTYKYLLAAPAVCTATTCITLN